MNLEQTAVLVLADSPAECDRLHEVLASVARSGGSRYAVSQAVLHAPDAFSELMAGRVDVVLLDGTGSAEAALDAVVRARVDAADVAVVVLVGGSDADEAFGLHAVQAGAQDYLVKEQLDGHLLARVLRYAIERQRLQATLRQLSLTDELTGLYNRRGFTTLSEHHLKLAHRTRGLLLARADIVGLRSINERFGREEGDRALVAAADVLRETFRASDVIARLRSDDFAVLVLDASDETVDVLQPRLRARLRSLSASRPELPYELEIEMRIVRFDPSMPPVVEELLAASARAPGEA
ncbi:MAG TPA: diguanylate cyclase [Gemmatimonadaceae bacterium]|nr:diguanylate cyclase [Gemmatimonadaceae bacterium]